MPLPRWIKAMLCCCAAALVTLTPVGRAAAQAPPSLTPRGACCLGSCCYLVCRTTCLLNAGVYRGDYTCCTPVNPCVPHGACCLADCNGVVSCFFTTQSLCCANGGSFRGVGSCCSPDPCPHPPTGACCIINCPTPSCTVTTSTVCALRQGSYQGNSTACSPTACAVGACCVLDFYFHANCIIRTSGGCAAANGTYRGDFTACSPTTCPQPIIGACCLPPGPTIGGRCVFATQAACATAYGDFHQGVTCAAANCPHCPCDWDGDGRVTSNDYNTFLNDWLAGRGDFNHDGVTNNQDVSDFLSCLQSPPAGCIRG